MTPREAAITLNLIPGLGPVRVMRLMQVFASPELVLEAPASMLMDIPGIGAQLARHISSWRSIVNPYRELELADKAGATVTTVFDASYPAALRELTDAPIVLYSWGSWTAGDSERSIAVVLYCILSVGLDTPQIVVPVAMHQFCVDNGNI